MMISNSSGEHSFSKMKLVKNRLQTSTEEERLVNSSQLSLESEMVCELSFDDILHESKKKGAKSSI